MRERFSLFSLVFLVGISLLGGCITNRPPKEVHAKARPNIILIMADDLGYETLSCNGGESYDTPNLDALASKGVRFTRAYATPLCTPSRVQIMTGKYNFRNYQRFGFLDPNEKTFANYLKDAGYQTAVAGKWQLEGDTKAPNAFGFDQYCLWQLNRGDFWYRYKNPKIIKDGIRLSEAETKNQYGPQLFTDYILDFITEHKEEPFFVYYPMALVHDPFQPTPDHRNYDDFNIEGLNDTTYFKNMMGQMDLQVGRIHTHLKSLGLLDNTIILFTGDNGTDRKVISSFQGQKIKGNKGYTTEAGTHVPMILYAKGAINNAREYTHLVDFTDILPSLLDMANIKNENLITDGNSFWETVKLNNKEAPRDYVFCAYSPRWAKFPERIYVQDTLYKLYADGQFFNFIEDPREVLPISPETLSVDQQKHHSNLTAALAKYLPDAKKFIERP